MSTYFFFIRPGILFLFFLWNFPAAKRNTNYKIPFCRRPFFGPYGGTHKRWRRRNFRILYPMAAALLFTLGKPSRRKIWITNTDTLSNPGRHFTGLYIPSNLKRPKSVSFTNVTLGFFYFLAKNTFPVIKNAPDFYLYRSLKYADVSKTHDHITLIDLRQTLDRIERFYWFPRLLKRNDKHINPTTIRIARVRIFL